MKKLLLILLVLVTANVYAQKQPQTLGGKQTVVVVQSDLQVDSLFILPVRDTNFTPAKPSMVYRPQDRTVYVHNGIKWSGLNIFNIVDSVYSRSDSIFFTKNGNERFVSKNIKSITWPSGFNATNTGGNITLTTTVNGLIIGNGSGISTATINSPLIFSSGALGIRKASATDSGYLSAEDWAAFNGKLSSSRQVNTINSITGGGDLTQNRSIQLVNDLLNPGPLKIYSTDASGIKGWFNIPLSAPTVTSAFGRIGDIAADSGDYGSFYAPLNHTHVSSHITNFTQAVRNLFTGGAGINVNNETGVISWPGTGVITSLNGLNAAAQTFAPAGEISINSFGTEHTFNVPYRIDSIKKSNDSVYALKGEIWRFQYIDADAGTGTDNASYHTITPFSDSSGFTINRPNGTRDTIVFVPVTGAGGTGAGSSSLSALTAAVATNTINNANYTQTWQWNGLSATGLQLSSSSSAASGNKQKLINATLTGTNTNSGEQTYVIVGSNQHAGSGSVNVGVYGIADNGEANFAVWGQASGANTASAGVYGTNSGAGAAGKFSNTGGGPSIYTTQGNVGFGAYPNQKAILELWSTTQGFLMPRMSTAQRDAITSVPEGLMVYDLTVHKVSVYNGSSWKYLLYE